LNLDTILMSSQAAIFAQQIRERPITTTLILCMTIIWIILWRRKVDAQKIAFQYQKVINDFQYWRTVTGAFSHLNILHLLFNMMSLWSLGGLEHMLGIVVYLKFTFILMIGSMLIMIFFIYLSSNYFNRPQDKETYTLGYSGVVFGWMSISSIVGPSNWNILGLPIPTALAPFVSLILTQLIIPNASFVGHLAGIVIGYLIAFGVFGWFSNFLFVVSSQWFLIVFIWSLIKTTSLPLPFSIQQQQVEETNRRRTRVINGVLTIVD